jgi:hypothetical protein
VRVEVRTQAELDAALAKGDLPVLAADITFVISEGSPRVEAYDSSQPRVEAYGSSQPTVVAYDSSQPTVEAYDSSQPTVVAYDSSQPRVEAYDSSQPRVVAYDSSQPTVEAYGSSQPTVEAYDSSQPTVVAYDSSQPRVVAYGSSQPRVEAYGSSQPRVEANGSSQPTEAYDSSQPTVVAYDSSQPTVEAYGSSQPTVEAYDSSQPTVVAYDSSQPRVVAYGIVQLCVKGAVKVTAAAAVAIAVLGGSPLITGGGFVSRKDISTPAKWCDFYGARVSGGVAILFKAVKQDFTPPCHAGNGVVYTPGTSPVAPDWDGGKKECGGGLHFSPTIPATLKFHSDNPRWMACPVALADLVVHPDGQYPEKVKARGCAAPIWEVGRDGVPVAGAVVSWPPAAEEVAVTSPRTKRKPAKRKAARS